MGRDRSDPGDYLTLRPGDPAVQGNRPGYIEQGEGLWPGNRADRVSHRPGLLPRGQREQQHHQRHAARRSGSLAGDLAALGAEQRSRTTGEWILYGIGLLATLAVTVFVTRLARKALASRIPPEKETG